MMCLVIESDLCKVPDLDEDGRVLGESEVVVDRAEPRVLIFGLLSEGEVEVLVI